MAPGAEMAISVPYTVAVPKRGTEETVETEQAASNISRVGVQTVFAEAEKEKLIACEACALLQKNMVGARRSPASHFLLQEDMESNRR